jgi:hypothetical protein
MSDDVRQVVRNEEIVVAGDPPQTVTTQTTAGGVVPAAPVAPVAGVTPVVPATASTVQTTTTPGDRVVSHNVAVSDINPAEEKAANMGWLNSLVWFIAGLIIALLAIRFVLAMTGANPDAGFANLIYGVSAPFRAPFAGLFGKPFTYEGAAATAQIEFEDLVAMAVYALVAWGITKILSLMLGTNRTRATVYTDNTRNTRL